MSAVKIESILSGFSTVTGTPNEVREFLVTKKSERVIALTVNHGSQQEIQSMAETVSRIAPLLKKVIARRQNDEMEAIVEALVPNVPLPERMFAEARMMGQARSAVFESCEWLTAAQVAELSGFSTTNPSAQPNKWKKSGQIFAVNHKGVDYFPGFALNPDENYRPYKALGDVIKVLGEKKSAWGLAYWFASVNSFLGGIAPHTLLAKEPERVLAAAHDEVMELTHG